MNYSFKSNSDMYYVYIIRIREDAIPLYVGKGKHNRVLWHMYASCGGYHYNKKLENKLRKITDNFSKLEMIEIHIDSEYVDEKSALNREIELIREIGLVNLCNLTPGGDNPPHSTEIIRKIVNKRRYNGRPWHSDATRQKIGKSRLGKLHSEETKLKFKLSGRKPMLGKLHSKETKELMSINHADFNGTNNPFYGKIHSEETREKLRLRNGLVWTIQHNEIETTVIGKGGVRKYVEEYNALHNTNISYNTLIVYKRIKKHNIQLVQNQ